MVNLCYTSQQMKYFHGTVILSWHFLKLYIMNTLMRTFLVHLKPCSFLKAHFTFAEVPTLNHEVFNHTMECGAFVAQLLSSCFANSFFTCKKVKQRIYRLSLNKFQGLFLPNFMGAITKI